MVVVTPRWVRRGATTAALLLVAVMLTACVEANSQSAIGSDLKGTTKMRVGVAKVALANLAANRDADTPGTDDLFNGLTRQVVALGGTAMPYESGDYTGLDILFGFTSLEEMQRQVNTVLGNTADVSGMPGLAGGATGRANPLVQIRATSTDARVRIDGNVDPLSTINDSSATSVATGGVNVVGLLSNGGTIALAFRMPGAIIATDELADTDGTTASWSFDIGDNAATIFVESQRNA